jgi:lysophospholipid acyltransferase (LPLAT)-like uncharacterized protein
MSRKKKHLQRKIKFLLLSKVALPILIIIYKIWAKTFRLDKSNISDIEEMFTNERIVFAIYHGNSSALLPWVPVMRPFGRDIVAMTSPSRDGQLIDSVLAAFGQHKVKGSSSSKAKSATLAMIDEVKEGRAGLLTVDGPKGPLGVPKPGFITVARHGKAVLYTVVVSANRSIQFGSWDRLFIPMPFATLTVRVKAFDLSDELEPRVVTIRRLQRQLWEEGRAIDCPITRELKRPELLNEEMD